MDKLHSLAAWQHIQQQFFATGEAAPVLAGLSAAIEQMTIDAFQASLAGLSDPNIAMLAVGGFGRRELFPFSDVDVLILIDRESQAAGIKSALSEFVRVLWDAGLRLSHSVRTVTECAEIHEGNVELSISLLDRRLLGGSQDIYAKLENKLQGFFERQSRVLTRHLCQLARAYGLHAFAAVLSALSGAARSKSAELRRAGVAHRTSVRGLSRTGRADA